MTHSVLVPTTRALFGKLYEQLARHRAIGEALDAARFHLHNHPEKYEVQRGPERVPLRLYDWFVPALYQSGADVPLLRKAGKGAHIETTAPRTNLPAGPESGFFGRRSELWDIERGFAAKARRITLTGFGGQGKTALALEAGRWLTRTGLFESAVFVDYSRVQAADAVAVAVSHIGTVLGESLPDAGAAEQALKRTATLVILDNLESLAAEPLRELLAAANGWSESGGTRVLLTTRTPDFGHPDYRIEGTNVHRRILLAGLGRRKAPDDALEWFAELAKLPPAPEVPSPSREALIELFDRVRFHPLSIRVLAQQLKTRRPAELASASAGCSPPLRPARPDRRTRRPSCWPRYASRSTGWTSTPERCCLGSASSRAGRSRRTSSRSPASATSKPARPAPSGPCCGGNWSRRRWSRPSPCRGSSRRSCASIRHWPPCSGSS